MTSERGIGAFLRRVLRLQATNEHRDQHASDPSLDRISSTESREPERLERQQVQTTTATVPARPSTPKTHDPLRSVTEGSISPPSPGQSSRITATTTATSATSRTNITSNPGLVPPVGANPDTASVMTIASSSKRRRRSMEMNASTRALAAESIRSTADSGEY